jgi:hypothetical protein
MVVFIHGPRVAMKKHDLEHYASTRVLGVSISHGFDFITVDLVEKCHSGAACVLNVAVFVQISVSRSAANVAAFTAAMGSTSVFAAFATAAQLIA